MKNSFFKFNLYSYILQFINALRKNIPYFFKTTIAITTLGLTFILPLIFSSTAHAEPLKVVASFSIIADLVEQVGAEHVEVTSLIRHGSDAHMFEPSAQDARTLSRADLLFINGLGFEPWMERLKTAAGFKGAEITLTQGITPLSFFLSNDEEDNDDEPHQENHENTGNSEHPEHSHHSHAAHEHSDHDHDHHNHGEFDPHAWQDVRNAIIYVRNIEAALIQADPENAQHYTARAQAYITQLETLDQTIRNSIATLPENHRVLITTHDAFGYFGRAYGMTIISAMGISTEEEPSAANIAQLIQQVRSVQAPALFLENITNPALMQQITRETQATLGGELYSDALSAPNTPASTYIGMMQSNLQTMMQALSEN